jgi:hypothetical protein
MSAALFLSAGLLPGGNMSESEPADKGSLQSSPAAILANTSYSWVDATAIGQAMQIEDWMNSSGEQNDDEGQATVALPWTFPWFGASFSYLHIDANGNVGFSDWPDDTWIGDNRIPSAGEPNNRIALFYEDMAGPVTGACSGQEGAVYTAYDTAVDRFIVEYYNWCSWKDYQLNTFQVLLYPDGRVIVQYQNVPSAPSTLVYGHPAGSSPIGIEGPDGEAGIIWPGEPQSGAAWIYQPAESQGTNRLFLPVVVEN